MRIYLIVVILLMLLTGQVIAQDDEQNQDEESLDITELWSYGLISIRTGDPLIEEGGEHQLDEDDIVYGYNLVTDVDGRTLSPSGAPLKGGEQLILTEDYQDDINTREYARIVSIMALIRDTILYRFEETTLEEWLEVTEILTLNEIKIDDAETIDRRSILSTEQIYDYVASSPTDGSPVMRYLEEAELELKCLAFQDFDFTNPEGENHCEDMGLELGSGLVLPEETDDDVND